MVGFAALLLAFATTSCPEHLQNVRAALEHGDFSAASANLDAARPSCSQEAQFQRFDTLVKALRGADADAEILLDHDPPFFLFYAGTLLASGQLKHLNSVVSAHASALSSPLLFSLAGLYAQRGHYPETIALLKRIPAPQADEAVYFNLGLAHSALRQFTEARRDYFAAIDKHPGYAEAYLRVGIDYAAEGDARYALPWLYRARELSPDSTKAEYPLAQQLIALHYFDSAAKLLENSLQLHPGAPMLLAAQGDLDLARGDNAKARAAYQSALSASPGLAAALLGMARCDAAEGKDEDAQKSLQQILASDPNDAAANAELGRLELNSNNTSAAQLHLERAWQSNPSPSNRIVGLALARLFRQNGQPGRALAVLQHLETQHGSSIELHLELARVYSALHHLEQARSEEQMVKALQTQNANALHFDDPKTYVQ